MPPPMTRNFAGDVAKVQRAGRIHDARILRQPRDARGLRARGDDALLEADQLLRAVGIHDLDAMCRDKARRATDDSHLALLRQDREARGQLADDAVLPLLERGRVDFGFLEADAVLRHGLRLLDHARGVQERLRRDAADIEADAAELRPAVHQRDGQAEIGRAECSGVAARSCADDEELRRLVCGPLVGGARGPARCRRSLGRRGLCDHDRLFQRRDPDRITAGRREDRDQRVLRHAVALPELDLLHDAGGGRRHVHRRLVGLERDERRFGHDPVARLDQHLDDLDVVEIPEIRDPLLDELAQGTASVRLCGDASASATATTKRTAWAPSMTRWS